MTVTISGWAQREIDEAALYYEGEQQGLGHRFLDEVDHGLLQISLFPNAWQRVSPRSRRYRLKRFPYGLVYQVRPEGILVLAAMHLKRKPDYWKHREQP